MASASPASGGDATAPPKQDVGLEVQHITESSSTSGTTKAQSSLVAFFKYIRIYWLDWVAFFLILIGAVVAALLTPYAFYVNAHYMEAYMYPARYNTIPLPAVFIIALAFPLLVYLVFFFVMTKDAFDLHQSIKGTLYALITSSVMVDGFRVCFGWPRPNFFLICFPNGVAKYGSDGNAECTAASSQVNYGRGSFPNRDTTMVFTGVLFVALYVAGKFHAFNCSGHLFRLIPSIILFACACCVAVNRVDDYVASPFDVFAGAVIGTFWASLYYFMLYPSLTDKSCNAPRFEFMRDEVEAAAGRSSQAGSLPASFKASTVESHQVSDL